MTGFSNVEGLANLPRPHASSMAIGRIIARRRELGPIDLTDTGHLLHLDELLRDLEAELRGTAKNPTDPAAKRDLLLEMGARIVAWLEENEEPLGRDLMRLGAVA